MELKMYAMYLAKYAYYVYLGRYPLESVAKSFTKMLTELGIADEELTDVDVENIAKLAAMIIDENRETVLADKVVEKQEVMAVGESFAKKVTAYLAGDKVEVIVKMDFKRA